MCAAAAGDEPHVQQLLSANCLGAYYTRTGIDVPTRELAARLRHTLGPRRMRAPRPHPYFSKDNDMTSRNWLLTGVSSGFGRELATQLLDRGANPA